MEPKSLALLLTCALMAAPMGANAGEVTYDFSGTVTQATGIYSSLVTVGAPITGTYRIDLANFNPTYSPFYKQPVPENQYWIAQEVSGSGFGIPPTNAYVFSSTAKSGSFSYQTNPVASSYDSDTDVEGAPTSNPAFFSGYEVNYSNATNYVGSQFMLNSAGVAIPFFSTGLPDFYLVATATGAIFSYDNATGALSAVVYTITLPNPSDFTLTPGPISFTNEYVDEASLPMKVVLTNTSSAALPIASIVLAGSNATQFKQTSNCRTSLAIGASCTISLVFEPISIGAKKTTLFVNAGGTSGTQTVALTGTGIAAPFTVSPRSLSFGSQSVGTTGASQSVTVTNASGAALPITITLSGTNSNQFPTTTTCGSSIAVGGYCTIAVSFTPTTTGAKSAKLNVAAGGSDGVQIVTLAGAGA